MILSALIFLVLVVVICIAVAAAAFAIVRSEKATPVIGCLSLIVAVAGSFVATKQIRRHWLGGAEEEQMQAGYRAVVEQLDRVLDSSSGRNPLADDMTRSGILIIESSQDGLRVDTQRMKLIPEELRTKPAREPRYAIVLATGESQVGYRYGAGAGPLMRKSMSAALYELPSKENLRMAYGKHILRSRLWVRMPKQAFAELVEDAVCRERAMRAVPSIRVALTGCEPSLVAGLPLEEGTEISISTAGEAFSAVLRRNHETVNIEVTQSGDGEGCSSRAKQTLDTRTRVGGACDWHSVSARVNGSWVPVTRSDGLTRAVAFRRDQCRIEPLGVSAAAPAYEGDRVRRIFESGGVENEIVCERLSGSAYRVRVTRGAPRR